MTLPKGWTKAKLGEFTLERVEQGEPGASAVPYIDIGSIDRDLKRVGSAQKVTGRNAPTRARQWVRPGDVLVSLTRPNLNAVALVGPELDGAVASTGFDVLRPQGILPEWVFNRVRSQAFVSDVCEGVQGVVYPAIRPADVRRHELPIPPAQEQQRIVEAIDSYLTRLDDAVASLKIVQAKLKAYRASLLRAAVEGRLVPSEASLAHAEKRGYEPADALLSGILQEHRRRWEEAELAKLTLVGKTPKNGKWKAKYQEPSAPDTSALPVLPEGWCWASVGQLVASLDQGWSPKCKKRPASSDEWGVMKTTAVQHLAFLEDENKAITADLQPRANLELRVGDLLVTRAGPRTRVGVCCLVRQVRRRVMLCDKVYRLKVNDGLSTSYVEVALNSPIVLNELEKLKTGISDSGVNLTQERFKALAIPIPPRREQDAIELAVSKQLSVSDDVRRMASADLRRITRLKQALLKRAFEGKLVDQDRTDEPAERLLARIRAERAGVIAPKKTLGRRARKAS